jgi:formylglycine-generating enzyme required for sulfatase activity/dienelactone hydrolase
MPSERWQQLETLFAEAVALPVDRRQTFVDDASGTDTGLRNELTALLATVEHTRPFLSSTALDVFAQQISREGWSVQPGDTIGSYAIERRLGSGGRGEVWRARDERIGRDVAIKLLLPHPANGERLSALHDEARAAGALNHPNVVTVYDVGSHGTAPYLVTECLEGESLRTRLGAGALPLDAALAIAVQIARGLAAAHGRGIVHGDLKPENVFVGVDGQVKILDFGLATLHDPVARPDADARPAAVTGTVSYMAPEQLRGEGADARTDVFALGIVLHEMLTGRRPFEADGTVGTIERILTGQVATLSGVNHAIPQGVCDLVDRCLAKAPADRLDSVDHAVSTIESAIRGRQPRAWASLVAFARRPVVSVIGLLTVAAIAAGAWQWRLAAGRLQWARSVAAVEARRHFDHGEYAEAYFLARRAVAAAPDDRALQQLWIEMSVPERLRIEPDGVDVAIAAYRTSTPGWLALGRTPLTGVRMPRGQIRMRLSKAGHDTVEVASAQRREHYRLEPTADVPPGMVRVTGGPLEHGGVDGTLEDFWINRLEVTNEQFQVFVDQGGYRRPELWREPFVDGGRILARADAMARFRDRTGQPGPATWSGGRYPDGRGRFPVGGVSWYEAAAYAAFVGQSLPTIHHWYRAAAPGRFADILAVSNFSGQGPAPVGHHGGLGPFGTLDMAGNVKEWCSTGVGGQRGLLGAAWDDARYVFAHYDARAPLERAPQFGFRLARYPRPLSAAIGGPVRLDALVRDGRTLKAAANEVFAVIQQQYAYDRAPLHAVVEATERTDDWTRVTVAIDGPPGGGRLRVHLFLPQRGAAPYQAIVFFPSHDAFQLRSSRDLSLRQVSFIMRSGRALLYPVYEGTYERATDETLTANGRRARRIAWSRQLGRGIDYLESRPDIDAARVGFYGISAGADAGTILTALEPRLKASVLQGTGIWGDETPESNAVDYAPRIRVPTLMLNGRYDFATPPDTAQGPLFDLLGTPPGRKRHVVLDVGHAMPIDAAARETLPWFDRYLGPVTLTPGS